MMRPSFSSARNSFQFDQWPTRFALAINTRGASSCVRNTPTGLPDCTSSVSSLPSASSSRTMAWNEGQSRAALPEPPYTTRSSGRSATSGSRLFMSMRSAASCFQPLQRRVAPRGARISAGVRISRAGIWLAKPPCFNDTRSARHHSGHPPAQRLDCRGECVAVDGYVVAPRDGVEARGDPFLRLLRGRGVDAGDFFVLARCGDDFLDGIEKIRMMELRWNAHGLREI